MFYLFLGLFVCLSLAAIIWSIIDAKTGLHSSPHRQGLSWQQSSGRLKKGSLGRKGYTLQKKLLRMLHHDQATVDRLLRSAEYRHPGRSQQWYLEKVIYDLERDRRN